MRSRQFTTVFAACVTASAGGLVISVVGLKLALTSWWIGGGAVAGVASMSGFYLLGRAHEALRIERRSATS